ncbi:MAG TPA: ClpXP protease specificity-enhancing factor SspB [Geminicoccaceae bacterium]
MPEKSLDYGQLVERALRQVVRDALGIVAKRGLPGRHHHYITFRTDHPGVVLAEELRARYPTEMTIVLQHEFWGLEVGDDRFAVGLSFGGAPHRLEIPLDAVTMFADPSVEFGLQFAKADAAPADGSTPPGAAAEPATEAGKPPAGGGAEVVTLDRFRKK